MGQARNRLNIWCFKVIRFPDYWMNSLSLQRALPCIAVVCNYKKVQIAYADQRPNPPSPVGRVTGPLQMVSKHKNW